LPCPFERSPCLEEREAQPSERLEPSRYRPDFEEGRWPKLVLQRKNPCARADAELSHQIEHRSLSCRRGFLHRFEGMADARRNGCRLEQANGLPAFFEQWAASVDGLALQRKRGGADGAPKQIGPRRGFARFDVENDFAGARLAARAWFASNCARSIALPLLVRWPASSLSR